MGIGEDIRDLIDRAGNNTRRLQLLQPVGLWKPAKYLFKKWNQGRPIADAKPVGHKALIVGPFRMSDNIRKASKLRIVAYDQHKEPVGAFEHLARHDRRRGGSEPLRVLS